MPHTTAICVQFLSDDYRKIFPDLDLKVVGLALPDKINDTFTMDIDKKVVFTTGFNASTLFSI